MESFLLLPITPRPGSRWGRASPIRVKGSSGRGIHGQFRGSLAAWMKQTQQESPKCFTMGP